MRNQTSSQPNFESETNVLISTSAKATLNETGNKLCHYLNKELAIYKEILSLEKEKTVSIQKNDATLLKSTSQKQQQLVAQAESLELLRETILQILNRETKNSFTKISQIILSEVLGEKHSNLLSTSSQDLKDIILALKSIVNLNHEELKQNQELFHTLLDELSEKKTDGYKQPGVRPNKIEQPTKAMFIDTNG